MIWFTADFHLGHKRIMKYCKRPFRNVDEMDIILIENFNALVKPSDTTYFLGDFCFRKDPADYISMLNGYQVFLWGNHDKTRLFKSFPKECMYEGYGVKIHMTHFPADSRIHGYDISLCGHVHEKWKVNEKGVINVGVDVWEFRPVSIKEIIRYHTRGA